MKLDKIVYHFPKEAKNILYEENTTNFKEIKEELFPLFLMSVCKIKLDMIG